jgi:hypothetical protein
MDGEAYEIKVMGCKENGRPSLHRHHL